MVALVAVGGIYAALPAYLLAGPRWLLLAVVCVLTVPSMVTHHTGHHSVNQILGYIISGVETAALSFSVVALVVALPSHKEEPVVLLRSAAALWFSNVLIFALWYWRLDAGSPYHRDVRAGHTDGAFLFPQMTMTDEQRAETGETNWSPRFVDYLFLSFNTSTALSPTDVPVLSRWAKALMMIQSMISLTVVVLLAARGVNIL